MFKALTRANIIDSSEPQVLFSVRIIPTLHKYSCISASGYVLIVTISNVILQNIEVDLTTRCHSSPLYNLLRELPTRLTSRLISSTCMRYLFRLIHVFSHTKAVNFVEAILQRLFYISINNRSDRLL